MQAGQSAPHRFVAAQHDALGGLRCHIWTAFRSGRDVILQQPFVAVTHTAKVWRQRLDAAVGCCASRKAATSHTHRLKGCCPSRRDHNGYNKDLLKPPRHLQTAQALSSSSAGKAGQRLVRLALAAVGNRPSFTVSVSMYGMSQTRRGPRVRPG